MFRILQPLLRGFAVLLLLCAFIPNADAQRGNRTSDSLKAVVAERRAALGHSDSLGHLTESVLGRMELAPLLTGPDAISALRTAATLADSSGLLKLELQARSMLATQLARGGKATEAYTEALTLVALEREVATTERDSLNAAHQASAERSLAVRDSLEQVGGMQQAALTARLKSTEERMQLWMWIALGTAAIALALLAWLLYRMGRVSKKLQGAMAGLQQEVAELKDFRNRRKEEQPKPDKPVASPAVAPPGSPLPSPQAQAIIEAMDPVVAALFRKSAPERLATLRAARSTGDQDKVLRVVHSLKPQLTSFDADRFTPLCARIRESGSQDDLAAWNADLDTLERGVEDVLRGLGQ